MATMAIFTHLILFSSITAAIFALSFRPFIRAKIKSWVWTNSKTLSGLLMFSPLVVVIKGLLIAEIQQSQHKKFIGSPSGLTPNLIYCRSQRHSIFKPRSVMAVYRWGRTPLRYLAAPSEPQLSMSIIKRNSTRGKCKSIYMYFFV